MIHLRDLTVKNFMSVGNTTQAINFDRSDLTLVLGENLDMGGDGHQEPADGGCDPAHPAGWGRQIGDAPRDL